MKYIVNIFLKVEKDLDDFKLFKDNIKFWREYCQNNNYKYILITDENWKEFVNSEYFDFINDLRYIWNKIDFIRYCALNTLGDDALYIDLDMTPIFNTKIDIIKIYHSQKIQIGGWLNEKKEKYIHCNNLIRMPRELSQKLIDYSIEQYNIKYHIKQYDTWKIRFMLQTTGANMFVRFCKIHKLRICMGYMDLFRNGETKTWLEEPFK